MRLYGKQVNFDQDTCQLGTQSRQSWSTYSLILRPVLAKAAMPSSHNFQENQKYRTPAIEDRKGKENSSASGGN